MRRDAETATLGEIARSVSDPAFLAALCHDLRGPLGAIGTWVHVLASGRADPATQQQALAAMQRDVVAQSRLVEQVSDLSSILAGTLELCSEAVELGPLLAQEGIALKTDGSASLRVLGDPRRLRQIFAILCGVPGEAVAPGPVLAVDQAADAVCLRGVVRKGAPEHVGLTLARALADMHRGHLSLSPSEDGTAFAIRLPTAESTT